MSSETKEVISTAVETKPVPKKKGRKPKNAVEQPAIPPVDEKSKTVKSKKEREVVVHRELEAIHSNWERRKKIRQDAGVEFLNDLQGFMKNLFYLDYLKDNFPQIHLAIIENLDQKKQVEYVRWLFQENSRKSAPEESKEE